RSQRHSSHHARGAKPRTGRGNTEARKRGRTFIKSLDKSRRCFCASGFRRPLTRKRGSTETRKVFCFRVSASPAVENPLRPRFRVLVQTSSANESRSLSNTKYPAKKVTIDPTSKASSHFQWPCGPM